MCHYARKKVRAGTAVRHQEVKMELGVIYNYKKSRKQRSIIFVNMGVACLFYIAGLYGYEYIYSKSFPEHLRSIYIIAFSVSSAILFYVAWWQRTHPATYEAIITTDRFIVNYPGSSKWSFNVKISDIKRFEHRNTLSHAGQGVGESGILLNDGRFYEISMNYGNNIKEMYMAIKSINPEVTFPKTVNKKVFGGLSKDYDK